MFAPESWNMAKIDQEVKTNFKDERHRCITSVIVTANWVNRKFTDYLAPYDLSSPQFNILRILRGAKDWVSMNDIKTLMVEKSPHTTRLVTKLMDKELVERRRSEKDRRVVYIGITDKGLNLLAEIDQQEENWVSFLNEITEEEAKTVTAILDKLRI